MACFVIIGWFEMVASPAPGQPAYSPVTRDVLPVPNQYARANRVHTAQGRQIIDSKMERIRLNTLAFPGVPLNAVVQSLNEEVKKLDLDKKGINFILSANVDPIPAPPAAINSQTGLPEACAKRTKLERTAVTSLDLLPAIHATTPPMLWHFHWWLGRFPIRSHPHWLCPNGSHRWANFAPSSA